MNEINESNIEELVEQAEDLVSTATPSNNEYIPENIIPIKIDNLYEVQIDEKLFKNGVDSVSELCGAITALSNVGITPAAALTYLSDKYLNEKAGELNLEISKINADANIESYKYSSANLSKMSY